MNVLQFPDRQRRIRGWTAENFQRDTAREMFFRICECTNVEELQDIAISYLAIAQSYRVKAEQTAEEAWYAVMAKLSRIMEEGPQPPRV